LASGLDTHIFYLVYLCHSGACIVTLVDLVALAVKRLDSEVSSFSSRSWINRPSDRHDEWLLSRYELDCCVRNHLAFNSTRETLSA
jgi:hypothetical protein